MPVVVYSFAAAILGVVFLWSGAAKLARLGLWRSVLQGYGLPGAPLLLVTVPLVELGVPVLLLLERSRASAALALALLAGFSAAIVRARMLQGDRLPCGCFGGADARDYRLLLARNVSLALVAATVIARGEDLTPLEGLGAPDAADALPAALVVLGVVVIVWTIRAVAGNSTDLRRGGR